MNPEILISGKIIESIARAVEKPPDTGELLKNLTADVSEAVEALQDGTDLLVQQALHLAATCDSVCCMNRSWPRAQHRDIFGSELDVPARRGLCVRPCHRRVPHRRHSWCRGSGHEHGPRVDPQRTPAPVARHKYIGEFYGKRPFAARRREGAEAENPDSGRFRFSDGITDRTGLPRRGHGAGRSGIDRIGGRATVLGVEEMGDVKIAEITEHADAVEKVTISSINNTKNAAENSINATKTAAVKVMGDTEIATVTTVRTAAQTAVTQSETTRDQCVAKVTSTAQAAANSVTQQLVLGRKTFFFGQL